MPNDGDREIINGEETGLIWSSIDEEYQHPDLYQHPEKYHSLEIRYPERFRNFDEFPPIDGEPEYDKDGLETGLVWSDKHNDWVYPDLDENLYLYHNEENLERILNEEGR
jgi:hypothetical protein